MALAWDKVIAAIATPLTIAKARVKPGFVFIILSSSAFEPERVRIQTRSRRGLPILTSTAIILFSICPAIENMIYRTHRKGARPWQVFGRECLKCT